MVAERTLKRLGQILLRAVACGRTAGKLREYSSRHVALRMDSIDTPAMLAHDVKAPLVE